ncbi:unnamed protein product [Paramecium octaurelia]|uniref:Uncharacterized protein n=1 Tax=Paramecium octaurelia TaxID=43137 RepID=A0A8S1WBC0_PAROT|nr:unnamed protein product [Paramecium octaurelia]
MQDFKRTKLETSCNEIQSQFNQIIHKELRISQLSMDQLVQSRKVIINLMNKLVKSLNTKRINPHLQNNPYQQFNKTSNSHSTNRKQLNLWGIRILDLRLKPLLNRKNKEITNLFI